MGDASPRPRAALDLSPRERLGLKLGRAATLLSSMVWTLAALAFVAIVIDARKGDLASALGLIAVISFAMPVVLLLAMSLRGVVALARGPDVGIAMQLAVAQLLVALAVAYLHWLEIGMLIATVPLAIAALAGTSARLTWRLRRSR